MPWPTFLGINCGPGQHCVDGYCSIAQSAVLTAGNDEACRVLAGICRDGDCMEGKRGKYYEGKKFQSIKSHSIKIPSTWYILNILLGFQNELAAKLIQESNVFHICPTLASFTRLFQHSLFQ